MKIKKNDTVLVLSGKDAGKTAKVLVAMPKTNKVVVDGVNVQKRHTKARSANQVSEIKSQSGPIDASNVLVVCPTCNKATRVSYKVEGDKKVRVCKKCGAVLDVAEKLCDRVGIIKNGELVAEGEVKELLKDKSLESFFLEIQNA